MTLPEIGLKTKNKRTVKKYRRENFRKFQQKKLQKHLLNKNAIKCRRRKQRLGFFNNPFKMFMVR